MAATNIKTIPLITDPSMTGLDRSISDGLISVSSIDCVLLIDSVALFVIVSSGLCVKPSYPLNSVRLLTGSDVEVVRVVVVFVVVLVVVGLGMENLKQLPFTELKIDRAFVNGASFDDASKAILNSSIQLGKIFHLNLVAEGVETQQDWDFIADSGCDEVQGYFIAQAMSADQFIEWKIQWEKEAKKKHIHTSSNNY